MTNSCESNCNNNQEMNKCETSKYKKSDESDESNELNDEVAESQTFVPCEDETTSLMTMTSTTLKEMETAAFKVFEQTLELYKPTELMFSFNGGKDCTIVLHMLCHFLRLKYAMELIHLPVLYIQNDLAFVEVDEFVDRMAKYYGINLIKRKGHIKDVLHEICNEMPQIKVVYMGCRRTDPYCQNLNVMQFTDRGYPELMRVNPILEWSCHDVWNYIKGNNVPYCCLYDKGYTSLGNRKNTIPNPHLRVTDPQTGKCSYRPAYELKDCTFERAGRL